MPAFETAIVEFGRRVGLHGTLTTDVHHQMNIRPLYNATVFKILIAGAETSPAQAPMGSTSTTHGSTSFTMATTSFMHLPPVIRHWIYHLR